VGADVDPRGSGDNGGPGRVPNGAQIEKCITPERIISGGDRKEGGGLTSINVSDLEGYDSPVQSKREKNRSRNVGRQRATLLLKQQGKKQKFCDLTMGVKSP